MTSDLKHVGLYTSRGFPRLSPDHFVHRTPYSVRVSRLNPYYSVWGRRHQPERDNNTVKCEKFRNRKRRETSVDYQFYASSNIVLWTVMDRQGEELQARDVTTFLDGWKQLFAYLPHRTTTSHTFQLRHRVDHVKGQ